ncbi:hypothetical protein WA158_001439 [Blastocystis sp. Blastoise]
MSLETPLVIDNGTGLTKIGFASNFEPDYVFPTAIGLRSQLSTIRSGTKRNEYLEDIDFVIGSDAIQNPDYLVNYPISHGIIQNWDHMEKLWQRSIYHLLRCDPSEHPILLTEPFNNPLENKEFTAEIMFESFNVPALYMAPQAVLCLYASHTATNTTMTGCIVDAGEGGTTVIPVAEGYVLSSSSRVLPIGGKDITAFIHKQLRLRNEKIPPEDMMDTCRYIKEHYCYSADNIWKEFKKYDSNKDKFQTYSSRATRTKQLWSIDVGYEQFLAPELYFNPEIISPEYTEPLSTIVDNCILKCPIDTRRSLYNNIVIAGGSSLFKGFGKRLQRDINRSVKARIESNRQEISSKLSSAEVIAEKSIDVNVTEPKDRQYASYIGGSYVASNPNFLSGCVTKEQYDEYGSSVMIKRSLSHL